MKKLIALISLVAKTVISVSVFEACGEDLSVEGQMTAKVTINNQEVTITCLTDCK